MLCKGCHAAALSAPSAVSQHWLLQRTTPVRRAPRHSVAPCAASVAAEASIAPAVAHRTLPAPKDAHFEEGSTVFVEEFRIRGNEAGPDQRANIITIANLLQEVGGNHGVAMWGRASSGFAAMPGMDHLIFVATRMQIRMEAYPSWGDLVRLETYFNEDGRLATRRDWRILDAVTGEYLGAATSTWVTINSETRKLAKIPEGVKQKFRRLAPSPPRSSIPTSDTRRKLPDFVWPPQLTAPSQLGRRSDMDPNGHINNVAYLAWAMEVIPEHVYSNYQLTEVEMDFKAECTAGDQIECFGMPLTDCSSTNGQHQQFLHLLRKGGSDVEVWRARTTWKPQQLQARDSHIMAASVVNGASLPSKPAASNGKAACNGVNGSIAAVPAKSSSSSSSSNGSKASAAGRTASCSIPDCSNTSCSNSQASSSR